MRLIENTVHDHAKKEGKKVTPVREIHTDFEIGEI